MICIISGCGLLWTRISGIYTAYCNFICAQSRVSKAAGIARSFQSSITAFAECQFCSWSDAPSRPNFVYESSSHGSANTHLPARRHRACAYAISPCSPEPPLWHVELEAPLHQLCPWVHGLNSFPNGDLLLRNFAYPPTCLRGKPRITRIWDGAPSPKHELVGAPSPSVVFTATLGHTTGSLMTLSEMVYSCGLSRVSLRC
jgi:hypothetical protein